MRWSICQPFFGYESPGERHDCGHEVRFIREQIAFALDKKISAEIAACMEAELTEYNAKQKAA